MQNNIYIFQSESSFTKYGINNIPIGTEYIIFLFYIRNLEIENLPFTVKKIFYAGGGDVREPKNFDDDFNNLLKETEEENKRKVLKCFKKIPFGTEFKFVYRKYRNGKQFGIECRKSVDGNYFISKKDIENFKIDNICFINKFNDTTIKLMKPDKEYYNFKIIDDK